MAALINDSAGVIATNTAAIQLANARDKPRYFYHSYKLQQFPKRRIYLALFQATKRLHCSNKSVPDFMQCCTIQLPREGKQVCSAV